ncbi:2-succinyl-5-enolpyruvyl-6-hydroxy-3-cyclohexene-1-carboxylic-acid synthase [Oceanobacillus alkalisoli]|uniref:2-succinyl-5-enolpyruvyl-6-hydroxy-3- cyclohexene-1-carboxylic-acid synthase n=1 Tax=Oceanobacillus alkalisoli TaxID=2925113 RepID=UPI001EF00E08|nr:2-succinyl-5-enolpyruvyl-6-hydroxy-3-cyclohexene-1-carboxylic-acid synthase [Oceanobacillus alkalisoli]MCF3943483.1 2-succinyl-5-enolpyruvyl-6-hydroxy-3-cyclohexene-1-carboxylic-acid synthase [Oceanobacillus alkalisoli]MCG5104071.1 2-succinyl-5-enolpyruvyl-6-hydroxy-3-cyclohexene-1-carboxylic-acid synthase [Oceanobacillus alkalisoli]
MNYIEILTRYTANFVDEMNENGIQHVVISPGSRSTPLALAFSEHEAIKEWIVIDERSAAFFALGLAKQTKAAVALVCTSGTAAANYYPAIVEAHYSRVPLVVMTADRPHELRDVGAPQAIDQFHLYGNYVKWFQEMALPEVENGMLRYVRQKAARSVYMACEGNPGPVHLNFPFREPLALDFSLEGIWEYDGMTEQATLLPLDGKKQLTEKQLEAFVSRLEGMRNGLIVCGPQADDEQFPEQIVALAQKWQLPVLADPLSGLRSGSHHKTNIIETYDALLKDKAIRDRMKPDFIIRFGAMPVSKAYLFFMKENETTPQFIIENHSGYREPTGNVTEFIFADPSAFCEGLLAFRQPAFSEDWLHDWQAMNEVARNHFLFGREEKITEGEAIRGLREVIPEESTLYVGNSMAVRDVDTFFLSDEKEISILANRGANGIDGMVSSGVGAAAAGKRVTLVLGDLSFFHDMNGLHAAKHYELDITILLINNNGGGIFSFLSQAENPKHFEALFGTPLHLDFAKAAELYEANYFTPETEEELKEVLQVSYEKKGLSIVEVKTDREENVKWHREKWQAIADEILAE